MLWVRCSSIADVPRIAAVIDEMFRNSSAETRSETEKIYLSNMVAHFRPLANFVQAIGISAMAAVALAVLNAAAMSLRERLGDIAIMKSLGFSAAQVMFGFVLESSVTAIGGAMLGTIIATALLERARGFFPSLGPLLSFGLPTPVMMGGFAVAVMVGVLAGVAPALPAVRARPQMILRKAV
ncbi:MAG TPA: FtsX-like permease family protein, partial [Candidatus Binataceae bacterium]|nr:FtsX-like permease family protein [Candidatus Binataceae bacterium]